MSGSEGDRAAAAGGFVGRRQQRGRRRRGSFRWRACGSWDSLTRRRERRGRRRCGSCQRDGWPAPRRVAGEGGFTPWWVAWSTASSLVASSPLRIAASCSNLQIPYPSSGVTYLGFCGPSSGRWPWLRAALWVAAGGFDAGSSVSAVSANLLQISFSSVTEVCGQRQPCRWISP